MDSLDLQVLKRRRASGARKGVPVWLVTVLETWGSAPRPPGALLAMRDDGLVVGSVSGGCVEDDLIDRVRSGERVATPRW
jgi:xanthine dehydrogenase accessory factor